MGTWKRETAAMRALGTDPIFSNLIVKKFDRRLHVRLRAASVKYGKSIRKITVEAVALWLREEKRKEKEKRQRTNSEFHPVGIDPVEGDASL